MFFITGFETIDNSHGFLEVGCTRTFGYVDEFDKAKYALNNNILDMWETVYNYAIVEEIGCGIHSKYLNRWLFKFDIERKGFFQIDEPEELKHYINFAIG